MENTDRLKKSPSVVEGHGIHVCNKCGWPFPNPRPSAKLRKAHKRVCGTIDGYKIGDNKACLDGSDEEHLSDNDSKIPIKVNFEGLKAVEKASEMTVSSRSFSGIGSGSNKSTRSEDDVFSDAVMDFGDASGVSDSGNVRGSAKKIEISEDDRVSKTVAGGSDIQLQTVDCSGPEKGKVDIDTSSLYNLSSSTLNSSSNSGLFTREEESLGTDDMLRCSDISAVLDSGEKGSQKEEKSEDLTSVRTEKAGMTSKAVLLPQKNVDSLEHLLAPEDATMEVIGKENDTFGEINDSFPKDNFDMQLNGLENSSEVIEDEDVKAGSFHLLVVADETPLREHSKVLPEKLPVAAPLDPAPEVGCLGLGEAFVTQDTLSNGSLVESNESENNSSNDINSEALYQEVYVERKSEKNDTHATDAYVSGSEGVELHSGKDVNESGQGKSTLTEEQNPLVLADTSLQSVKDESVIHTHSIRSVKLNHSDSERNNEDAEFSEALESDTAKVEEVDSPLTDETSFSYDIYIAAERKLLEGGNGDYDVRSTEAEMLSADAPSVLGFEDRMDDEVEVERKYGHLFEVQDSKITVTDSGSPSEQIVGGESADVVIARDIASGAVEVHVAEQTYDDENRVQKASDYPDVILSKKAKDNDAQLEKIEIPGVKDADDKMSGAEHNGKVDLGLFSDNEDDIELSQNAVDGFNTGMHGTASAFTDVDMKLVKQDVAVSELDLQADLISQTDSLEGNWGSISVLSTLSDAPAATETGSQPSQEVVQAEKANLQPKSNNEKIDMFQPSSYIIPAAEKGTDGSNQNDGVPESQTSQNPEEHGVRFPSLTLMGNELSGKKREEEIIAKVTNWSTGKQHMPLKSYLGESSPSAKDNPPPPAVSHEAKNTGIYTKESVNDTVRSELGKEWNSPARYPANIKREKGKVRSRPLWAPFICCSSVQTS